MVQAILTFAMLGFKLPIGICTNIEATIRKFWWRKRRDRRKIHWRNRKNCVKLKMPVAWVLKNWGSLMTLCSQSRFGGFLLTTILSPIRSLKQSIFLGPRGMIFDAKCGLVGSFAWKSILKVRKVISTVMRWRVGDGSWIHIFEDSWLSDGN